MNLKEMTTTVKREITDAIKGIDSNPEHIAGFPAHRNACSKSTPLKLRQELKPLPSFNGPNFSEGNTTVSCTECGGSFITI